MPKTCMVTSTRFDESVQKLAKNLRTFEDVGDDTTAGMVAIRDALQSLHTIRDELMREAPREGSELVERISAGFTREEANAVLEVLNHRIALGGRRPPGLVRASVRVEDVVRNFDALDFNRTGRLRPRRGS